MTKQRYSWTAVGDINAFFGLMLDNLAGLVLTVTLLAGVFGFPVNFAMRYMVPGTAIGVLAGDLMFFAMALWLVRRTGRRDVTAMPLGLDTPSTFGMIFMVLGPAYLQAKAVATTPEELEAAAGYAWSIGVCCIVFSGLLKLLFAFFSPWARRTFPRAGLLGSLAAIALVLITFFPILEIFAAPLVGLLSLAIVLTTLVARITLPYRLPGALGAVLVASLVYYLILGLQQVTDLELLHTPTNLTWEDARAGLLPTEWTTIFTFQWLTVWRDALQYLPIVAPFAIATVVGGIDCTESAAAAGDDYPTGGVIAVEAVATLIAGLCGGVIQTTPYIGHPAYKAMGGRSAYTLATALFIGSAGVLGYFGYIYLILPSVAIIPILVFIGLEIGAQSFAATPKRHYTAVALAMIPALAVLGKGMVDKVMTDPAVVAAGITTTSLLPNNQVALQVLHALYGGFIITSLLWASALAALIDRQLIRGGVLFLVCGGLTLFGVIHSPLPNSEMFVIWPGDQPLPGTLRDPRQIQDVLVWAASYAGVAIFLFALAAWHRAHPDQSPDSAAPDNAHDA
jgi:AGZA family xanthine/uracil permease-like MFS transporter